MIELDDLFLVYRALDHDVAALRGLSLSVPAGERVVIRGPSGSGKSSLVKIVVGELRPSAGRASVLGTDLTRATDSESLRWRRASIGVVAQSDGARLLDDLTAVQNVELQARLSGVGRRTARSGATEMLDRVGVGHLAGRMPGSLSGGERQRVALAAALCLRPQLIVADEPTGELDAENARGVYDVLSAVSREHSATLLIVTHDDAAEVIADRVITIRDGRLGEERRTTDGVQRLVVDGRGWVRLPEAARLAAGISRTVVADVQASSEARPGSLTLTAGGSSSEESGSSTGRASVSDSTVPLGAPIRPQPAAPSVRTGQHGEASVVASLSAASVVVGDVCVLAPTDFSVFAGELVAITGRSGSGKTTLMSVLCGMIAPAAGSVRPPSAQVALVPRVPGFDETMTGRTNIALSLALRRGTNQSSEAPSGSAAHVAGTDDSAHPASLDDLAAELGLGVLLDRPVSSLSGGERQRLAVLRALAGSLTCIAADEPTSQLDEANAHSVAAALRTAADLGCAVVVATHDPELVAAAHRVYSLD